MIQLSKDHSDISVIGVGAHRACYIHPDVDGTQISQDSLYNLK